jgi:hypothetical protein
MSRVAIALFTLVLVGCGDRPISAPSYEPDQCLRAQLFHQCLATVPKGPEATRYNDWDEVVSACESAAYHQSLRAIGTVPQQCSFYEAASKGGAQP